MKKRVEPFLPRPQRRASCLLVSAIAMTIITPEAARATLYRLTMTATLNFVGCPSAISCPAFPLMWGVSGGEGVTLEVIFDDAIPAAVIDDATPLYVSARYDHALPLATPLGVDVQFGPYSAAAGSRGATPDRYAISVFDDLGSGCCPGLPESVGVEMLVPPLSVTLAGPDGFHDLDLKSVRLDFLNYGGGGNLLTGAALLPGFPELAWDESRLTVEVFDPIYGRDGRAFIDVMSVVSVEPVAIQSVPAVSRGGAILLIGTIVLIATRLTSTRPRWTIR